MSKGVIYKYKSKGGEIIKAVAINDEQESCYSEHGKMFLRILDDNFAIKKAEDGRGFFAVKNSDELIQIGFWD